MKPRKQRQRIALETPSMEESGEVAAAQNSAATEQSPPAAPSEEQNVDVLLSLKIKHLEIMAKELGYVLQPRKSLVLEVMENISTRMRNREGAFIYQVAAVTIPGFPSALAHDLFPPHLIQAETQSGCLVTWAAHNITDLRALLHNMLEACPDYLTGISKALRKPSEKVIRVFGAVNVNVVSQYPEKAFNKENV